MGLDGVTSAVCVLYSPGDTLGKALAYFSILPYCLILHQVSKVYCRREVHEALTLFGLVVNEGIARALKHLVNSSRPPTCAQLGVCDSHGWPSSHTSCMFFYFSYAACMLLYKHPRVTDTASRVSRAVEMVFVLYVSVTVGISRVYLGYHTTQQVIAGAAIGLCAGACCYIVISWLSHTFDAIAERFSAFHVKNTWKVAEPLSFERDMYRYAHFKAS